MLRIDVDGRPCVLRLDRAPDSFRDPARQHACQAIAAAAGLAPALIASDARSGLSLSAFVETAASEPPRAEKLAQIAAAVRRLHDGPPFPTLVPFLDGMDAVLGHFIAARLAPTWVGERATSLLEQIRSAYRAEADDFVASHNDLNPGNILIGATGVLFIDWESAFAADRFVDIAAILNYFAADNAEDSTLILTAYFGRPPTSLQAAKAEAMRQINRLFYGSILLMAAAQQGGLATERDFDGPGYETLRQGQIEAASARGKIELACAFLSDAFRNDRDPALAAALAQA